MAAQPTLRDPVRNVDMEFFSYLELLDQGARPLPGSFVRRQGGVDPRLTGLKVMMTAQGAVGPREGDEIALYEHVAMVRNRKTGHYFIAFRETIDALMARQTDPEKYPEWLMKHPVKRTELKVHVARVAGKPRNKYDTTWIEWLPDTPEGDRVFDSICYYLLRKGVLKEEMYGDSVG